MQKNPRFQKFCKLAEERKIFLKHQNKQSQVLFKNFQEKARETFLNQCMKMACTNQEQVNLLKQLLNEIRLNPNLLNLPDIKEENREIIQRLEKKWNQIQEGLKQQNKVKDNIFQKFYKQSALSQESERSPNVMFVLATEAKIKQIFLLFSKDKANYRTPLLSTSSAINKVQYSYSLYRSQLPEGSKLLIQHQDKKQLLEISNLKMYLRRFSKAAIIALDFTSQDCQNVRTTSILYCIGGLYHVLYIQDKIREKTYEWLSLLYQECFKVKSRDFKIVTSFQAILPVQLTNSLSKDKKTLLQSAFYVVSRLYTYILMSLLTKKQEIMAVYLSKQNKLMNSLMYPLFKEHEYVENKHLPQFQKIYRQLCWRYSLKVDKDQQLRVRMSKFAIFSQEDSQSLEMIRILVNQSPKILASFAEDDMLKAITRNKYISAGAVLHIVSKLLKMIIQLRKEIDKRETFVVKLFDAILIKLENADQLYHQMEKTCFWDEEISRQVCELILKSSSDQIFTDNKNWLEFYIILKKISFYHGGMYKIVMGIVEQPFERKYQDHEANVKSIQAFCRLPESQFDHALLKKGVNSKHFDISEIQKVVNSRYNNPQMFNCKLFDQYFCGYLQTQFKQARALKKLGETLKMLDKLILRLKNIDQIAEIALNLLQTVDFSKVYYKKEEQISHFLKLFINLKSELKLICYDRLKNMLLSGKIDKLGQIIANLQPQMKEIDHQYLENICKELQGNKRGSESQNTQFWNALCSKQQCSSKLKPFKFNKQNLQQLVQSANFKIQSNDLYGPQISQLNLNKKHILNQLGSLGQQICQNIQLSYQMLQSFKQKLRGAKELMQTQQNFIGQITQLSEIESSIEKTKLNLLYHMQQLPKTLKQFVQISSIFKRLIVPCHYWNKKTQKIYGIEQYLSIYKEIMERMKDQLQQFHQKQQYSYVQYQKLIKNQPIAQWCKTVFKDAQQAFVIQTNIQQLRPEKLQYINQIILSIESIQKERDKNVPVRPSFTNFKGLFSKITNKQKVEVKVLLKQVKQVLTQFQVDFKANSMNQIQSNFQVKLICLVHQHGKMLKEIKSMKISPEVILNLKQYISGHIYSNIKNQDVTSFEEVVDFVKNSHNKKFSDLIMYLKKEQTKQEKLKSLAESVQACADMFENIKEKLKQAEDRQASFKDEIQQIFRPQSASAWNIQIDQKSPYKLYYFLSLKRSKSFIKRNRLEESLLQSDSLNLMELQSLSQNCLMFKSESQKNVQYRSFAGLLNKFLAFYKLIMIIKQKCQKLLQYGYNPIELLAKLPLEENFASLKQYEEEKVTRNLKQWQEEIMDAYKQAYFLTFFKGYAIQQLINSILYTKKIPERLAFQFQITQQEFLSLYNLPLLAQQLLKKPNSEKQKIRFVRKFLTELQTIYKQKDKSKFIEIQTSKQSNRISLLVVHQKKQIYHICREKQLSLHEIFFCLRETTILQLETFVLRSLRGRNKKYFIIGAQWLSVQVKNELFNVLIRYYTKSNSNPTGRKLFFIDTNSSDTLYCYLNWSLQIDFKLVVNEDNISQEEVVKNLNQNYFNRIKLITSTKPGLGKTYYVEREAAKEGKQVLYFPICGNINFKSLFQRLKAKKINKNTFLLLQLGYFAPEQQKSKRNVMVNMNKLEIFLTEIVVFRKFYLEGDYINIPKETKIFIQIQNVLQSAIYSQKSKQEVEIKDIQQTYRIYLLNLLDRAETKYHIDGFCLDHIQFKDDNLKDIYVLKYLQLLESKTVNTVNLKFRDLQPKVTRQSYESLRTWFSSEQFKVFFAEVSSNQSQIARENLLEQKINEKVCIDSGLIHNCVQALLKFSQTELQNYLSSLKNNNPLVVKTAKMKNFQSSLKKIEDQISNFRGPTYPPNRLHLINKYFKNRHQKDITYRTYRYFIETLFEKINTFSQSSYLQPQSFSYANSYYLKALDINKIRQNFLSVLIANASKLLQETTFTSIQESKSQFYSNLDSESTIILSAKDSNCYQFVYKDDKKVDFSIKTLLATQTSQYVSKTHKKSTLTSKIKEEINQLFHKESFNSLKEQDQETKINQILYSISENKNFLGSLEEVRKKVKAFNDYRLTKDNFFKICYIIQKAVSNLPIIIMGESGVGKTALIKFLVQEIYNQPLEICNVHAGIHQQQLTPLIETVKITAQSNKNKRVWVFFDEYNTSDQLSYIKEIVVDRRFLGEQLPANIIFCTACNPYRMDLRNKKKRAFNVKPPNLSMVAFMWDYEQLKQQQCKQYCMKMLKQITLKQKNVIIDTIVKLHEMIHSRHQKSYASLRDVARFKQLYLWFLRSVPKVPLDTKESSYSRQNYQISVEVRSLFLTYYFVYILKISNSREKQAIIEVIQQNFTLKKGFIENLVKNEQIDFTMRLKQSNDKIAYNKALRQNLFTSFVCILNKIPVLLIGEPGSSKSLSIKLINSNLRGKFSSKQYCRQFPQLLFHYFQGSQSSTSEGILKVFDVTNKKKPHNTQYCILFDEIGLAGKSIHNPLKVMHSKIETHNKDIAIIAISNEALDAAKMSRFLTVSREQVQKSELQQTAQQIYKAYIPNDQSKLKLVKETANHYYKFIQDQGKNCQEKYYGLRDFYCLIKYICSKFAEDMNTNEDKIVREAVRINFSTRAGQKPDYYRFLELASLKPEKAYKSAEQIIARNIKEVQSRYLLFAIEQNSIVEQVCQRIVEYNQKRTNIKCLYGSPFESDNSSQEYNIEFTSKIISYASNGGAIAIKDLNNSIQTSLYDMFNKSFTTVGKKKYCRVAVGDKSNPRCQIHPDFVVIMFVSKDRLSKLDPPFLNRFEKHTLNILEELDSGQKEQLSELQKWIKDLQKLWKDCKVKNRQNYLINTSRECLASLIYTAQPTHAKDLDWLKKKLIQNSTSQFDALVRKVCNQQEGIVNEILELKAQINEECGSDSSSYNPLKCSRDTVIFTFNTFEQLMKENQSNQQCAKYLKISYNEKELRQNITSALLCPASKVVQVNCNFEEDKDYLDYLLHLVKSIKGEHKSSATNRVRVVVELNRYLLWNYSRSREKTQPFKINVSYLHPFEQYFYDLSMQKIIKLKTQAQLFEHVFTDRLRLECFTVSISYFNILKEDRQSSQYYNYLYKVCDNPQFTNSLTAFILGILRKQEIDYAELMLEKNEEKITTEAMSRQMSSNNFKELLIGRLESKIIHFYRLVIHSLVKSKLIHLFNARKDSDEFWDEASKYECDYVDTAQATQRTLCSHFAQLQLQLKEEVQRNLVFDQDRFTHPCSYVLMNSVFYDERVQDASNIQFRARNFFFFVEKQNPNRSYIADTNAQQQQPEEFSNITVFARLGLKNPAEEFIVLTDIIGKLMSLLKLNKNLTIPIAYLLRAAEIQFSGKDRGNSLLNLTIMLTFSRDYSKLLIEMLEILLKSYKPQELKAQLLKHCSQSKLKHKPSDKRPQILKRTLEALLKCVIAVIGQTFSIRNSKVFQKGYIKASQQMFKKLDELMDLNSSFAKKYKLKYKLHIPAQTSAELKLVELFINSNLSSEEELLRRYIQQTGGLFDYVAVATFCEQLLKQAGSNKKEVSKIISYLAYGLLQHFGEDIENLEEDVKIEVVRKSKMIANGYPELANLLPLQLFPALFKQQEADQNNRMQKFQEFFDSIEKAHQDPCQLKSDQIDNFTISLSLYFRKFILNYFDNYLGDHHQDDEQYSYPHEIFKSQYTLYQKLMRIQRPTRVGYLFKNEFLKAYLQTYIEIIFQERIPNQEERQVLVEINSKLSTNKNLFITHLKIYLFKYIHHKFNDLQFQEIVDKIRQKAGEKLYAWMQFCVQCCDKNKDKTYYLPFNIFDSNQPFLKRFKAVQEAKFQSQQVTALIKQGLTTPQNTYYLLTFFATLFYTQQIKDAHRKTFTNVVNSLKQLQLPQNKLVKTFILLYLKGCLIAKQLQFNREEFAEYSRRLPMLNFLNLVISYRMVDNCYIEMFFNKGLPIKNIAQEFKEKFIFGVLSNPELIRCMELANNYQEKPKSKIYIKCLQKTCEYVFELEVKFTGLKDSLNESFSQGNDRSHYYSKSLNIFQSKTFVENCPLCLSQPPESGQPLKAIQHIDLIQHLQKLKAKHTVKQLKEADNNFYALKGFQLKNSKQDIFKYNLVRRNLEGLLSLYQQTLQQKDFSLMANNILELVMYFVWWVFSSVKQLDTSLLKTYQSSNQLKQIWLTYEAQLQKSIPKAQTNIYLYGICKFLKKQISQSYEQNAKRSTLLDQTAKIRFSGELQKSLALSLGQNVQNFIKENVYPRYSTIEDLIKQEGLVQLHKNQYKQIELFRTYEYTENYKLQEFNRVYLNSLQHSYPALYSMLYNIQKVQQIYKHLKTIYSFVYRILTNYNFALKRDCQKKPIDQIINNKILQKDANLKKKMENELLEFYQSWNYFAVELKLKLGTNRYLTQYQGIHFPLSHFIIDRNKTKQQSEMLSFITKTSQDYNSFCHSMQEKIQKHCFNNKQRRVLNAVVVNPTFLTSSTQFWTITSKTINKHIKKASHYGVVYGNSKCQFQFEQLQTSLIKELYSTHYLANPSKFKLFYFIDSDPMQDITQLASYREKLTTEDQHKIGSLQRQNRNIQAQFYQSLRQSLQKILYYLKYFKQDPTQCIGEFLKKQQKGYRDSVTMSNIQADVEQNTTHPFREIDVLFTRDPIASLPLAKLFSLFEHIKDLQTKSTTKSVPKGNSSVSITKNTRPRKKKGSDSD